MVNFIRFTDEKIFTVAAPNNSHNDRLYAAAGTRKREIAPARLLRTRPTYSHSVMVSVGVSALGRAAIRFVEPGVKVNGQYYRDVLLMQGLLPDICSFSDFFIFQQDDAPAHRAHDPGACQSEPSVFFITLTSLKFLGYHYQMCINAYCTVTQNVIFLLIELCNPSRLNCCI
jgi:hypothetical protein